MTSRNFESFFTPPFPIVTLLISKTKFLIFFYPLELIYGRSLKEIVKNEIHLYIPQINC